jgi:hypothetical protein
MSEKIYAWLLRLYPPQFREAYGDEALQLFRDRARDEKGFLPGLRLWLDLLADLAISVPREYRHSQPALIAASAHPRLEGLPSFHLLESESPRLGALLFGGVLSLAALGAFPVLTNHGRNYRPLNASVAQPQGSTYPRSAFRHQAPHAPDDANDETFASLHPATVATGSRSGDAKPGDFQSNSRMPLDGAGSPQPKAPQAEPHDVASAMNREGNSDVKLDAVERQRVIDGATVILKKYYIDRDNAQKMVDALLAHKKSGDDNAATDGAGFAALLTRQMRDVSPDRHLTLEYSQAHLPQNPTGPTAEGLAHYRAIMEQESCTFEKLQILRHNIGYLKLNSFPDLSVCRTTGVAAMAQLNRADAIIFDLRDNRGGEPDTVAFIAAYLFDHPEYWYNPRESTTQQSWTHSPVPGSNLADKPVYVLTSARTYSGAEQFSYDLKMLKRATLVGETTGGGAHAGVWHRIDDHFGMGIPETRAINPFSKTDWAEIGVEPDVKVKATDALEAAEKLAETSVQRKLAAGKVSE